jgi:hypothetical protein
VIRTKRELHSFKKERELRKRRQDWEQHEKSQERVFQVSKWKIKRKNYFKEAGAE